MDSNSGFGDGPNYDFGPGVNSGPGLNYGFGPEVNSGPGVNHGPGLNGNGFNSHGVNGGPNGFQGYGFNSHGGNDGPNGFQGYGLNSPRGNGGPTRVNGINVHCDEIITLLTAIYNNQSNTSYNTVTLLAIVVRLLDITACNTSPQQP
ncbi:hypothetical protein ACP275_08G041500 [Erythranthe tilingii]